jgi:hypothetical protein
VFSGNAYTGTTGLGVSVSEWNSISGYAYVLVKLKGSNANGSMGLRGIYTTD